MSGKWVQYYEYICHFDPPMAKTIDIVADNADLLHGKKSHILTCNRKNMIFSI